MSTPLYVVICPQGLGDSLEATPMVAALRAAKPRAEIEVVVMRRAAQSLFSQMPEIVDRVRYLPYWERGKYPFLMAALRMLSSRKAEASFLTYPSARAQYAYLHGLVRSKKHYTHVYPEARQIARVLPNVESVQIEERHNVLRNFDLLRRAGIDVAVPPAYSVPKSWRISGERHRRKIIIHAGSIAHDNLDQRRWPEASFAELARRLVAHRFDVALLCGPDEREVTHRVRAAAPGVALLEGSLDEMAREISGAAVVIANDNGIAHLAAGVGTPVISLFGPTPLFHAPYGPSSVPLRPSDCPPCFTPLQSGLSCVLGIGYRCMAIDLSVDLVEKTALDILSGTQEKSASGYAAASAKTR